MDHFGYIPDLDQPKVPSQQQPTEYDEKLADRRGSK